MRIAVNPNRMELLRLKRRLELARRGHKLLKDKQDELMKRFLPLIDEAKGLREEMEGSLLKASQRFLLARAVTRNEFLTEALIFPKQRIDIEISMVPVMNLRLPQFKLSVEGEPFSYGFVESPSDLDISISILSQILPKMVRLAQVEKWVKLLANEIEKTRRRVNALEYILIPSLEETIRYIGMKLSERERSTITRLMKVKEMVAPLR